MRSGSLQSEITSEEISKGSTSSWAVFATVAVVGLVVLAAAIRLWGLGVESLSHPEIYVPGIDLIAGISEPPPRHNFADAVWWHFHDEPHPMGWYLAMFGWTSVAGTSEFALRLPSVLFGAGAVALTFFLGRRVFSPAVGLLAALLLTLHGFHAFWSQIARMYTAGVFLGILATILVLTLFYGRRERPWLETSYVLTCIAGVQTAELFWPILLLHVAWASLVLERPAKVSFASLARPHAQGSRLLQVQSLALIFAAPALLHSVYRARHGAALDPSLGFLTDYFSFGFLMIRGDFRVPALELPTLIYWLVFAIALLCLVLSIGARSARSHEVVPGRPRALAPWILPVSALAVTIFMLWLAWIAHRRNLPLAATAILPVMAACAPLLGVFVRRLIARLPPVDRGLMSIDPGVLLLWLQGVAAPLVLMAASFFVAVLAERAFLIFVPCLLILMAAGALALGRKGPVRAMIVVSLIAVFSASVVFNEKRIISPNDYKGLAAAMLPLLQPGDLIFVRNRHWVDTPFFYYRLEGTYVAEQYSNALTANPDSRVWLVTWPGEAGVEFSDERHEALADYDKNHTVTALRATAELFEPSRLR